MIRLTLFAFILACVAGQSAAAQTLPDGLIFKKVRKAGSLKLRNCELVGGIRVFEVISRGRAIRPSARLNRKASALPARFSYFGCAQDDQGTTGLYARETETGPVSLFTFSLTDFPKKKRKSSSTGLGKACPGGSRGISFGVLYKPSADASDARQGKPVVLLQGGNKNRASALRIFASNGSEVCRFTFKASSIPGVNGGADHYFAGWSGGCGRTGSQIAAAARAASGNSNVYIEWKGGQCLGPVNPTSRVGGVG